MFRTSNVRKIIEDQIKDLRIRAYTVLILTFVAVSIFIVFAIRPAVTSIATDWEELQQLNVEDVTLKQNVIDTQNIIDQYNTSVVGAKLDILNTALPDSQETGPIFANMNAIAKTDNVSLSSIQFKIASTDTSDSSVNVPLQNASMKPLYIDITGVGKYGDILNLIKDYEAYPRTFNLYNVSLSPVVSNGNITTDISFSLKVYVYYFVKI